MSLKNIAYLASNTNKFYISHVGQHRDNGFLYKYGITSNLKNRLKTHNRNFPIFDVKYVAHTNYKELVEREFGRLIKKRDLHYPIMMQGHYYTEVFCLDEEKLLNNIIHEAELVVQKYKAIDLFLERTL